MLWWMKIWISSQWMNTLYLSFTQHGLFITGSYYVTISLTCVTFLLLVWLVPCVPLCVHLKDRDYTSYCQCKTFWYIYVYYSSNSIITFYTLVFCGVFLHTYSCSWKFLVNGMALTNTEDLAFYNWQLANCRFLLNVAMHLYSIPYLLFVLILKFYFHICWCIYFRYIFMWIFIIFQTWKCCFMHCLFYWWSSAIFQT